MSRRGIARRIGSWLARVAVAVALCATASPPQAACGVDLATYREQVAEARQLVDAAVGDSLTAREATDLAIEVNALVPLRVEIETADGTVEANNTIARSLVAQLDAADTVTERTEYVDDLAAHLAGLEVVLGADGIAVPEDPEALDALLEAAPSETRSPLQQYLADLIDKLSRMLEKWFSRVSGSSSAGVVFRIVFYAVVLALAGALAYAAVQLAQRVRAGVAARADSGATTASQDAVVEAARDLPVDALAYADQRMAAGEGREAVRALFGGAARALQEAGFIVEARTRTNGELLVEVRPRSPEAYGPLRELALVFERAWYGHRDVSADEYAAARSRYVAVADVAREAAVERSET